MKKFFIFLMAIMICTISVVPCYATELPYDSSAIPQAVYESDGYYIYQPSHLDYPFMISFRDINGAISSMNARFQVKGYGTKQILELRAADGEGDRQKFEFSMYEYDKNTSKFKLSGEYHTQQNTMYQIGDFGWEIYESTVNVYNIDGTIFFQVAPTTMELYQKIQKVTDQEMITLPAQVGGAMKILALCGVGCLALLMVLPLFGKVLNRYR